MISMICSIGRNNEIGKNNDLIWHIPNDMKFFKKMTMGHNVVMGKKTYESLPGKLSGRKMLILSSSISNDNADITIFRSMNDFLNYYKEHNHLEFFIIGGETIYKQFLDYADVIYLTEIDSECLSANSYFPKFDKSKWNREILSSDSYNDLNYLICKYIKK